MRNVLWVLVGLFVAFVLGVALFNFVIMPRFVQTNVEVVVPRLIGLEVAQGERLCHRRGLKLQVDDRRFSEGVPVDRVLSQTPTSDSRVKRGRTIRVHISLGTQMVTVPDIRGMTLRQARLQLDNANLVLGRVSRIYVGETGQEVRATRPRSGTETAVGNAIDVLVAVGERGHVMRSEDGITWEQAEVVPTQATLTTVESRGGRLWAAGHDAVTAARLDEGDLDEDSAALVARHYPTTEIRDGLQGSLSPTSCARAQEVFGYQARYNWTVSQRYPE